MSTRDVDHDGMTDDTDALLAALRAEHERAVAPPPSDGLVTLFRDGAAPAAAPAARRRRWARLAVAGAVAGVFGVGGLGAAGALPGPVQDTVAHLADVVGLELPRDEPDRPATTTKTSTTDRPAPVPPVTADGPTTPVIPLPARPDDPGRPEADPGRSGDAPGRNADAPGQADEAPGRADHTPEPAQGTSRRPVEISGTGSDGGRNPEGPADVDPPDRTGLAPQDHGGSNR